MTDELNSILRDIKRTLERATSHLGYIAWLLGAIAIAVAGLALYGIHC